MSQNKFRIIIFLIIILLTLSSCSAQSAKKTAILNNNSISDINEYEINSNRHTKPDNNSTFINDFGLDGFELKLENNYLQVWFNNKTKSIRVIDKSNGYIWGALKEEKDPNLNAVWNNFANSICSIEYFNSVGRSNKLSMSDRNVISTYEWDDNSLKCRFKAKKIGIEFNFSLQLKDKSISFQIDDKSILETDDFKLKSVYFVPFLGSVFEDSIPGYMFIPDGCGALIRFSKSSNYITGFDKKVYGEDGSIDNLSPVGTLLSNRINEYLVKENTVTLPVFGIAHGYKQNAFLAVIDKGEEYSSITSSPAGVVTGYNWTSIRFNYRELYTKIISGNGIPIVQSKMNKISPKVSFYFMSGDCATYSGMANLYREQLENKNILKKEDNQENIPMHLEILGATVKKGMIFNSVKTLTTEKQAIEILNTLNKDGINNMAVVYRGWQKGAQQKSSFKKIKPGWNVGGKIGLDNLKKIAKQNNSRLYLYLNPIMAHENQIYKSSDTAIGIDDTFIKQESSNENKLYRTNFFSKISLASNLISRKYNDFDFAYASVGNTLYSDYTKNNTYNRSSAIQSFKKSLSNHQSNALYNPNLYCYNYVSDYFDIPVNNSQYQFESDTVPFLQMVLKGRLNYYSEFINQGYFSQSTILKLIEYGVNPSFIVMSADNYSLSDTDEDDLFSISFNDWRNEIKNVYDKINKALSSVNSSTIKEHKVLSNGFVKVTYSNGKEIYINYLSKEMKDNNISIPAHSYLVN